MSITTHTEPVFYYDTFESDVPEDIEFAAKLDAECEERTNHAIDKLRAAYFDSGISMADKYSALAAYRKERRVIHLDQLNGGRDSVANNLRSFELLREIVGATESHYLRRLATWALNEELHGMSDAYGGMPIVDIDQQRSDSEALDRYFANEWGGSWAKGLVYGPSDYGHMLLEDYPEAQEAVQYMAEQSIEFPGLGESDGTYAPDPYMDLAAELPKGYFDQERAPGEAELTMETTHLFRVPYEDLSIQAQARLFEYGAGLDDDQVARIHGVTQDVSEDGRAHLAEAFLATEFGSHLGESILSIAEKDSQGEQSTEVFSVINGVRHHLRNWESRAWFAQEGSGYQEYFAGMKRAIEMRISQILSPLPDLMDGTPQMAEYFHRDGSHAETHAISSVEEVIQGLKLLELWTRKNAETEAQPASERRPMFGDDFSAARSVSDGLDVRRMMRPRGSAAGEARIRFTAAVTPEEQLAIFGRYIDVKKNGEPRGSKVSLRLDLEAISSRLSLDLGTRMQYGVGGEREYADRLLAHLMTAGVQHEARNQGKNIIHVDYHVRDTFVPELSEPDTFAGFVEAMQAHYIDPVALKLARQAGRLDQMEGSSERSDGSVVYTGLFLDAESVDRLKHLLPPGYVNLPRNPHVTIQFHPKMGIEGFEVGRDSVLQITGYVDDGKAQVLIVESEATTEVPNAHITVSTANNEQGKPIPPSYGKHAARRGEVIKFSEPISVNATSGYLDGRSGKIVLSAA